MEIGLDDTEVRVFRRMQSRLRKAGYSKRKRVYQARALEYVYALRLVAHYNELGPDSAEARRRYHESLHAARTIRRIETEADRKPKPEPEVPALDPLA